MENDIILKVQGLKKHYHLGVIGRGSLQADLQSFWARIRGKEDPNIQIGEEHKSGDFYALKGIDFEVHRGERLGIIGGNGAGKSTTLKILSHVTSPSEGAVCIDGRVSSMLEVGTGFHPELTGRENIYLNGAILGMSKREVDSKLNEIIDFSECGRFIDTPVKRYSSGMYVKLAFSVAAHLDSEIIIMDEVLAVGDAAFQKKCLDKMKSLSINDQRTILYVSHNMNTIRDLCDRCLVMKDGNIVFDGGVENAINYYMGLTETSDKVVNLSEFKRAKNVKQGIKIQEIASEYDGWKVNYGGHLRFKVTVEAESCVSNVSFRSRVSTVDHNSVTVLLATNVLEIVNPGKHSFILDADISQLVPGKYCLTPVLYTVNEFGGWNFFDHIEQAIVFEVLETNNFNQGMVWDTKYWGYVKLPEMKSV